MYLLLNIADEVILKYPYSIAQLREDNPQVSFPKNPTPNLLKEYNVYRVQQTEPPTVDHTKNIVELMPQLQDKDWVQTWDIIDASIEEVEYRTTEEAKTVRSTRNRYLSQCDWTQLADSSVNKEEWQTYRQALRDIPAQAGFPFDVVWPNQP